MEYVLGYTAANDVSSRTSQLNQSQWSFSKGFDGSCPLGKITSNQSWSLLTPDTGPTLVSTSLIPDPSALHIRGSKNGKVLQDCPLEYDMSQLATLYTYSVTNFVTATSSSAFQSLSASFPKARLYQQEQSSSPAHPPVSAWARHPRRL